jgi:membrane-bound metal-dependent hydrolase YbcI (DUF457 family)
MMGPTHALSGAVVGLLVLPQFSTGMLPLLSGIAVAAGAALWPDIDQPQSSVAHTFFWPGHALGKLVGNIAGGHRHATHSLLAAAAVGAGLFTISMASPFRALLLFLLVAPATHVGLKAKQDEVPLWLGLLGLALTGLLTYAWASSMSPTLLAVAAMSGWLAHLLGDALTKGGVPLLWPWAQRMSVPVLGHTGGVGERLVMMPALLVAGLYGLAQILR